MDRMVRAIFDTVDPEQVNLLGSRGRGDERQDSDVDLVVVEAEPFGPERRRNKEMVKLYHGAGRFSDRSRRPWLSSRRRRLLARLPQPRACAGATGG